MRIPTAEQIGAAIIAREEVEPWFGIFIAICAFAGLQKGEASALKVADVNFIKRELHVERQVPWTDHGQVEIREPKCGSERTTDIPDGLVTMISEYVRVWLPGDDKDRWLLPVHGIG